MLKGWTTKVKGWFGKNPKKSVNTSEAKHNVENQNETLDIEGQQQLQEESKENKEEKVARSLRPWKHKFIRNQIKSFTTTKRIERFNDEQLYNISRVLAKPNDIRKLVKEYIQENKEEDKFKKLMDRMINGYDPSNKRKIIDGVSDKGIIRVLVKKDIVQYSVRSITRFFTGMAFQFAYDLFLEDPNCLERLTPKSIEECSTNEMSSNVARTLGMVGCILAPLVVYKVASKLKGRAYRESEMLEYFDSAISQIDRNQIKNYFQYLMDNPSYDQQDWLQDIKHGPSSRPVNFQIQTASYAAAYAAFRNMDGSYGNVLIAAMKTAVKEVLLTSYKKIHGCVKDSNKKIFDEEFLDEFSEEEILAFSENVKSIMHKHTLRSTKARAMVVEFTDVAIFLSALGLDTTHPLLSGAKWAVASTLSSFVTMLNGLIEGRYKNKKNEVEIVEITDDEENKDTKSDAQDIELGDINLAIDNNGKVDSQENDDDVLFTLSHYEEKDSKEWDGPGIEPEALNAKPLKKPAPKQHI